MLHVLTDKSDTGDGCGG